MERGMASNPKMEYQVFLCIFQKNSAMATLGLKEMGKFLWEGREKGLPCWLSQFSKTKLRQPTGQTFFPTFPKEFSQFLRTYVAKFIEKMQKKILYYEKCVEHHASFPPRRFVKWICPIGYRLAKILS